ncbi:hypothetical protein GIX45_13625 [Erwinia sp. CPCC 100877]|nr:hypothetical protein [Erwinia sp. CPCC 100877]
MAFRGCYIVTKQQTDNIYHWTLANADAEGNISTLMFNRSYFVSGESFIAVGGAGSRVNITDEWPIQYEIEYLKGNLVDAVKAGKINGIIRGPAGELRNLMINFVGVEGRAERKAGVYSAVLPLYIE